MIYIEKHKQPKRQDTRSSLHPSELPAELKAELEKGYQGRPTPELEHLMG